MLLFFGLDVAFWQLNISNTVVRVWYIEKSRRELKIRRVAEPIFDELPEIWKFGQTRSFVFDIFSKFKFISRGKKIVKISAN